MRKSGISIVVLSAIVWSSTCAAQTEADRKAILATFDSWNQGWAEADATLAVSDYADDTDWTNAFGDRFEGKAALHDGLAYIFSLGFVMAGESAGNEYTDIRFLGSDVAIGPKQTGSLGAADIQRRGNARPPRQSSAGLREARRTMADR